MSDCSDKYKDIIDLPHHQSKKRQRMSMIDRAAQFSPFAALTGHNDAIIETARLTDRQIELDEGTKSIINEKIQMISDYLSEKPTVTITHFEPDIKKDGGAYIRPRFSKGGHSGSNRLSAHDTRDGGSNCRTIRNSRAYVPDLLSVQGRKGRCNDPRSAYGYSAKYRSALLRSVVCVADVVALCVACVNHRGMCVPGLCIDILE